MLKSESDGSFSQFTTLKVCLLLVLASILCLFSSFAFADSAAAWKAYQEGKNPLVEMSLLFVGVIVFFSLLVWVNKRMENKKKNRNRKKK